MWIYFFFYFQLRIIKWTAHIYKNLNKYLWIQIFVWKKENFHRKREKEIRMRNSKQKIVQKNLLRCCRIQFKLDLFGFVLILVFLFRYYSLFVAVSFTVTFLDCLLHAKPFFQQHTYTVTFFSFQNAMRLCSYTFYSNAFTFVVFCLSNTLLTHQSFPANFFFHIP